MPKDERERVEWRIIDVVLRDSVGIEVSMLELAVPRFSFRVGTAHYPTEDGGKVKIGPRLTIFNARDAIDLLIEVEEKYTEIREQRIEELEQRKSKVLKSQGNPEITVRKSHAEKL